MRNYVLTFLLFVLWNARSILSNLGDFQKRLGEIKPHIVCVTETWLKPIHNFGFQGYDFVTNDRLFSRGGGLGY